MGGFNPSLNEKLMRDGNPDGYIAMGTTAETLASQYKIGREEQDQFALASHRKAVSAMQQNKFANEIVPITITAEDGSASKTSKDEGPRADSSLEKLASLKPAFRKDGTVTAGNSSPLTDGASVLLVMSKKLAKKLKLQPLARVRSMAVAGVDPALMGIGPVAAVPKALQRAGLKMKDIDLIELNEAFAVQSLAVLKELGIDEKRVNIHGGAIALGHPLGASGARIMTTLLHAMKEKKAKYGLATMCVGGGQGVATIVERL